MENRQPGVFTENAPRENVFAGAVGALLFALAGGVVYFLLDRVGFIAGISGFVAVVCAAKGYQVFARGESKKGLVISVIAAVLVIVLAWYCTLAADVFSAYKEWYAAGEVDYEISFFDALRGGYRFLEEKEIAAAYFKDLAIGLGLCVIGGVGYVLGTARRLKEKAAVSAQPQAVYPQDAYPREDAAAQYPPYPQEIPQPQYPPYPQEPRGTEPDQTNP